MIVAATQNSRLLKVLLSPFSGLSLFLCISASETVKMGDPRSWYNASTLKNEPRWQAVNALHDTCLTSFYE